MNYAIILAAGSGTRFGAAMPKQMVRIAGRRLFEHTLTAFQTHPAIHGIVLIGNAIIMAQQDEIQRVFPKVVLVTPGGDTRAQSSAMALDALRTIAHPEDKVLIHDAVRPFVSPSMITAALNALETYDAVNTVVDCTDTIVRVENDVVAAIPDRSALKRGQTPQGFRYSKIAAAFARYLANDQTLHVTDDCAVYLHFRDPGDTPIGVAPGAQENIKITFSNDLLLAEEIFRLGFDQPFDSAAALHGKTALIFGGHAGIGAHTARRLTEAGMRVHCASRATLCDIRDSAAVEQAVRTAYAAAGRIDAVICTAGVLHTGAVGAQGIAAIQETIDTNLLGSINVARAVHGVLRESQGHLILFSSSSYTRGRADSAVYSATKAAIANITQALAEEWRLDNIQVNCIAPARTDTGLRSAHFSQSDSTDELLDPAAVAAHVERVLQSTVTGQIVPVSKARGERRGL